MQYGQDEEEYDNEKNSEFDKSNDDNDDQDKDLGDMSVSCTSDNGSASNTKSKYVITPSEIEYHYQQNLKLSQGNEINESHCSSDGTRHALRALRVLRKEGWKIVLSLCPRP